jgi:hypothetical protein
MSISFHVRKEKYGTPFEKYGTPFEKYGTPFQKYGTPFEKYGTPFENVALFIFCNCVNFKLKKQ